MRIVSIDPGYSGAWALVVDGKPLLVGDMPVAGEGAQKRVAATVLANAIRTRLPDLVVVESVAARPGQGVSGMFRLGCSFGIVLGVVGALGIPLELVTPQMWKAKFRLRGPDKEASRQKALQLAPDLADSLRRKMDHGRAEAILIGLYAAATWDRTPLRIDAPPGPAGDARQRCNVPPPAASDT